MDRKMVKVNSVSTDTDEVIETRIQDTVDAVANTGLSVVQVHIGAYGLQRLVDAFQRNGSFATITPRRGRGAQSLSYVTVMRGTAEDKSVDNPLPPTARNRCPRPELEPAATSESRVTKTKLKARKRGTGLLELEHAAKSANGVAKIELEKTIRHHSVDRIDYSEMPLHSPCSHECLKGRDADAMDDRFTLDSISPYFIPIMCGWRRIKNGMKWASLTEQQLKPITGCIYYRAPCGRPLKSMGEIAEYLRETRSELTLDLFSFSFFLDETAYVWVDPKFIKMDDIASGAEGRAIPVVNFIDKESPPSFIYRQRRYPLNKKMADTMGMTTSNQFCSGCDCTDDCSDWTKCACQRLTHRESIRTEHSFNHVTKGYTNRLLQEQLLSGLYECNENCGCSRKRCINRVVQNELKIPMQMVKTYAMGWGVRSLVDIPQGTFISCYHGAVLSDNIAEAHGDCDEYYADLDFYDLAENEKDNAGVDVLDQGVFFEDVGLRDLTPEEVKKVEMTDELKKIHRLQEATLRQQRPQDDIGAKQERRRKGEQKRIEKRLAQERKSGGAEKGEEEEEEMDQEERKEDEGIDEDDQGEEGEDEVDEGLEEVQMERKKEEKERKMQKMKKDREEAAKRWTIPVHGPDGDNQYTQYFKEADTDCLFLLDAKTGGNIGRQYNHSCDPNMYTQHIFVDTHDIRLPWVAFFAKRDIKAGEELVWDYGWTPSEDNPRGLKCMCGAEKCRIDLL